ncbi:hypothetical protein VPNG_02249 [Cytospora leucostoma]|uniref:Uncharacterized protein n=1 Tax=Cytospora leucostoma TaxID=1230097 RepID=A0A423XGG1_9PEZI|nr:hypothetical protein VPNG_02249 [Cytospora leucostoma]
MARAEESSDRLRNAVADVLGQETDQGIMTIFPMLENIEAQNNLLQLKMEQVFLRVPVLEEHVEERTTETREGEGD